MILNPAERKLLGEACVEHLQAREIEVLTIAIGAQHTHLQLKREPHRVIATLGHLKRALWYARRNSGNSDRLWATGRKIVPIKSRAHQNRVFHYILNHRKQGAWVWSYRD